MYPTKQFSLQKLVGNPNDPDFNSQTLRDVDPLGEIRDPFTDNDDFKIFRTDESPFLIYKTDLTDIPMMLYDVNNNTYYYNENFSLDTLVTNTDAELKYVQLTKDNQTITGNIEVDGELESNRFIAPTNGGTPIYTFNGRSGSGMSCDSSIGRLVLRSESGRVYSPEFFESNRFTFNLFSGGLRSVSTGVGAIFNQASNVMLFRDNEAEITNLLVLPASNIASSSSAPIAIQFRHPNIPAGTQAGIKYRALDNGTQVMNFFVNGSNIIDLSPNLSIFLSPMRFQSIGGVSGVGIRTVVRLPPSGTITVTNNTAYTETITLNQTMNNANYQVFYEVIILSGDPHVTVNTLSKSTTQVVADLYCLKGSGTIRLEAWFFAY